MTSDPDTTLSLDLPDASATEALGQAVSALLQPGDTLLLSGPIGAGKSHLARSAIRALMARADEPPEDIPSPTYTLVQTYPAGEIELWHADLYRLTDPSEVLELGLEEGLSEGICFVEWPDRLGSAAPPDALQIVLQAKGDGRIARLTGPADRWSDRLSALSTAVKADE
ncbi:tRNA (adenosine(37)-N6)-threonylcarbamoyltransferase complex ATPase subunit type 1 TsaE [Tropicimonas sp. TH_r6]|uniref:tRNA (adenosine(37)-N6)-threonylcarbamoyltransferase complex ATPase subunit type 1 TsaE n=1 Tax=Tropicimonas sp. TH_r6 TaxID=3082085 RepID=UPI002955D38D|nr:tRNA (adenosine(37)-N6)-threonylcarbamoyltransferase complex ATPase subunit type 1 TsaE [Tropicimonas sp. TH_r6]MDV7141299.1 tRNA (adenosine(37)-N6)-threonylcarbamoyltransferase complex ATPase subunit type 1 TsaE [Tropicimonas sp. TH_r6]